MSTLAESAMSHPDPASTGSTPPRVPRLATALGVIGAIALLAVLYARLPVREWVQAGLAFIENLGFWAPFAFVIFYALLTVLFVSGGLLTLFAGGFFGLAKGILIVVVASNLGASLAFLVGRHLARDWVSRKIEHYPAFRAIEKAVADDGWKIVGLTRLSPVFPFVFLNYAFGLTRVKFSHYLAASIVGMLPGTIMYVYLGALARAGATGVAKSPAQWALYIAGLLATIAVTILITRSARKALRENAVLEPEPQPEPD